MWEVGPGYRVFTGSVNITREVLDRHVEEGRGDRSALIWSNGGRWTYKELFTEVNAVAAGFKRMGIGRNAKVVVRSRNTPQAVASVLALYRLGAVPVWVNSLLKEEELRYIISNSESQYALTLEDLAQPLLNIQHSGALAGIVILDATSGHDHATVYDEIRAGGEELVTPEDTGGDDPAFMLYSSGTTGRPKGILHAHRWIITVGDPALLQMGYRSDDRIMTSSEFSFMGTFAHAFHFPLYAGSSIALYDKRARPDMVLDAVEEMGATIFMSVPTLYRSILADKSLAACSKLPRLRMAISTGESLGASTYEGWNSRYRIPLLEIYGVSEVEVVIGNSLSFPVKPGSIGKALPGFKLALLNKGLDPVPIGSEGVLMIHRSDPGLFLEYYRAPDRWRAQHRGEWYYTGDVMRCDEDGYYWYMGRDDDLFKSRGYLLSPQEIENVLLRHESVAEAAVVGVPDATLGNKVAAFVVTVPGTKPSDKLREELLVYVGQQLAPYKVPKIVNFVDSIPKNAVGKILRRSLQGDDLGVGSTR